MALIKNMGLAWIAVADAQRSQKFFSETLGLKMVESSPEYSWSEWQATEGEFRLGVGACAADQEGMRPGQNAIVTLTVDNIEQAKATLEAKGVRFYGDIIEVPGHVKMALFADPDNNLFQLVQSLS